MGPITIHGLPAGSYAVTVSCTFTKPAAGGMLAGIADGSVRVLNGAIAETLYWGAITPAGGEVLAGDW